MHQENGNAGLNHPSMSMLTRVGAKLLSCFCYSPSNQVRAIAVGSSDNPLELLEREYPDFEQLVAGKRVLDFGCGVGDQSIALAEKLGCKVLGLDSNVHTLNKAKERHSVGDVEFSTTVSHRKFDVVISQNSFEHFEDPEAILSEMVSVLVPGGIILLTFGPPWFAPFGAHMHHFCWLPWVNLLFSEKVVMSVREKYSADGARHYEEVTSGLNKMTIAKYEQILKKAGLIEQTKYQAVKQLNWLCRVPVLRELFTNHVTAVLRAP